MKRLKSLICLLFFLNILANAQQECGTKAYNGNDTAVLNRLAEQERKTKEWIDTSSESRAKYYKIEYPNIPGFTPIGDYFKDAATYTEAKKHFAVTDPEGYRKWCVKLFTKTVPLILTEEEQRKVAEKIKNIK